jgi:uncharacterized protein
MDMFEGCSGKTLAGGLTWLHEPPEWRFGEDGLTIVPGEKTDFYRPYGGGGRDNAALLSTTVEGDFTATAKAVTELVGFGDAAAITVRSSASKWAKLCLERSPVGDISAVSVVTDPWSDDANNELAPPICWLRLTRKGNLFGMHFSTDGTRWRFVRSFAMETPGSALVGIHAQAPFVGGCRVLFESFQIVPEPVEDFRSGA